MAEAPAGVFGITLVRLDINRFYSNCQGETEAKFMRALQTIDQIAPVTVLMDEIDEAFAQGEGDNEVSCRLLGAFLYWLQERKSKVFIVASANRISPLPHELMRTGRWDRSFFIDLPSKDERVAIFQIHLKKAGVTVTNFKMDELLTASTGYTGAEIEQAVVDAQYLALLMDARLKLLYSKRRTPEETTMGTRHSFALTVIPFDGWSRRRASPLLPYRARRTHGCRSTCGRKAGLDKSSSAETKVSPKTVTILRPRRPRKPTQLHRRGQMVGHRRGMRAHDRDILVLGDWR